MSRYRRPAAAIALTLSLAGLTVAVSACSLASPKVVMTPYAASDGHNADLVVEGRGTVQFRNFLLVSAAKGEPGVLVGAVTTDSVTQLPVQIAVLGPDGKTPLSDGVTVTVQPGQLTTFGGTEGGAALQVPKVDVPPGSVLTVAVRSASGATTFPLPVLARTGPYQSITPSAAPTSPSAEPTPGTATGAAPGTATGSPQSSPGAARTTSASATTTAG